jgi:hypothetical protein
MPRDVRTRWNSTYDMLEFAVEHREAIDLITGNQKMKLRQYELTEEDWTITQKLCDVLKVCSKLQYTIPFQLTPLYRFLRTQHSFSPVARPTSPRSFLPWTILMSTWQRRRLTPGIRSLSKQRLLSEKELSTGTMTKPTIPRSFVLPWVCFL